MGWFDEQIKLRKQSDDDAFADSFVKMAGAIALTASKSKLLIAVHTIKTEIAKNSCMLPEGRTSEKISWLIFGVSIPTKVTASAARTIIP